jgi:hypothetical protein
LNLIDFGRGSVRPGQLIRFWRDHVLIQKSREAETRGPYFAPAARAFCFLTTETGDLSEPLSGLPGLELAGVHKAFFKRFVDCGESAAETSRSSYSGVQLSMKPFRA